MVPLSKGQINSLLEFGNTVFSNNFVKHYGVANIIKAVKERLNLDITIRKCSDENETHPFYIAEKNRRVNAHNQPLSTCGNSI